MNATCGYENLEALVAQVSFHVPVSNNPRDIFAHEVEIREEDGQCSAGFIDILGKVLVRSRFA
jgi:hypothetical protein